MYRTAPYSDFAYAFLAASDPRPTRPEDRADATHVIELTGKVRLTQPLTLHAMKASPALADWSFLAYQQGIMRRRRDIREEGAWQALKRLLVAHNPGLRVFLSRAEGQRGGPVTSRSVLRVFVSYGSEDRRRVLALCRRLSRERFLKPWIDRMELKPGDVWEAAIDDAIHASDAVVICLSSRSVRKVGFFQTEIGRVLKVADRQPEGTTFIVPAKLEPCDVPKRLSRWQYAELFKPNGYQALLSGLRDRIRSLEESHQR